MDSVRRDIGSMTRELGRGFIGMLRPIRMDHTLFHKWLIKLIITGAWQATQPRTAPSDRNRPANILGTWPPSPESRVRAAEGPSDLPALRTQTEGYQEDREISQPTLPYGPTRRRKRLKMVSCRTQSHDMARNKPGTMSYSFIPLCQRRQVRVQIWWEWLFLIWWEWLFVYYY